VQGSIRHQLVYKKIDVLVCFYLVLVEMPFPTESTQLLTPPLFHLGPGLNRAWRASFLPEMPDGSKLMSWWNDQDLAVESSKRNR